MPQQQAASHWDAVIVGAGPAGLSAALILGRCKRRVLLTDTGTPRSAAAHRMHGFLSRDGMDLHAFRAIAREQLAIYPNVKFEPVEVSAIQRAAEHRFIATLSDGSEASARKILLATGVFDELPALPGIEHYYGTTVHPCPYCEGWELRDRPIAVYGKGTRGFEMARALSAWSSDLFLCTQGPARLSAEQRLTLRANGIEIITDPIIELLGERGRLRAVRFANGVERESHALFFDTPCHSQSPLAEMLGCRVSRSGHIACGRYGESSVAGVYAAGNILKDVQLSIVAAAEGARAAFGINLGLTREEFLPPGAAEHDSGRPRRKPAQVSSA